MREIRVLESCIPYVASNGIDINSNPNTFWNLIRPEENLGEFKSDGLTWKKLFPARQYVPEGKGFHFMISPFATDRFFTPTSLTLGQFTFPCELIWQFLNKCTRSPEETRFVAYVIGEDRSRKTAQTWHNFHIHFVRFDNEPLKPVDIFTMPDFLKGNRGGKEPFQEITRQILCEWFSECDDVSITSKDIYVPIQKFSSNDIRIVLPVNISGEELAKLLQALDRDYSELHKLVFSCFADNYDEAVMSKGAVPYNLRSQYEIEKRIRRISDEFKDSREYLLKLTHIGDFLRKRKDVDPQNWIITSHSYALMIFFQNDELTIIFAPRFFTRTGFLETIGIYSKRVDVDVSEVSIEQRLKAAQAEALKLSPM